MVTAVGIGIDRAHGKGVRKVGGAPQGQQLSFVGLANQGEEVRRRGGDRRVGDLKRTRVVILPIVQSL